MKAFITPDEAKKKLCPTCAVGDGELCVAGACMAWRWLPIQANDPRVVAAIKAAQEALGGAGKHKEAVASVMASPETHGIPTAPEKGWCGLGGKPVT